MYSFLLGGDHTNDSGDHIGGICMVFCSAKKATIQMVVTIQMATIQMTVDSIVFFNLFFASESMTIKNNDITIKLEKEFSIFVGQNKNEKIRGLQKEKSCNCFLNTNKI